MFLYLIVLIIVWVMIYFLLLYFGMNTALKIFLLNYICRFIDDESILLKILMIK